MSGTKGQLIIFHDATDDKDHSPRCGKMTPEQKRKFHKRNFRVTVAAHLSPTNLIQVGISCCSGKDGFNRKKGAELAKERLATHPVQIGGITEVSDDTDKKRFSRAVKLVKSYSHDLRKKVSKDRHHDLHSIIFKQN